MSSLREHITSCKKYSVAIAVVYVAIATFFIRSKRRKVSESPSSDNHAVAGGSKEPSTPVIGDSDNPLLYTPVAGGSKEPSTPVLGTPSVTGESGNPFLVVPSKEPSVAQEELQQKVETPPVRY